MINPLLDLTEDSTNIKRTQKRDRNSNQILRSGDFLFIPDSTLYRIQKVTFLVNSDMLVDYCLASAAEGTGGAGAPHPADGPPCDY